MGTSYGNTVGSGSILWTAEYLNNGFVICMIKPMNMFFTDIPLSSVQISRQYFRVYLF